MPMPLRSLRIDGREFDATHAGGRVVTVPVAKAILGWREALHLMPVGSQWRLFVPSRLAYGEEGLRPKNGAGPAIGPNETLVFDLELLAIKQSAGARAQTVVPRCRLRGRSERALARSAGSSAELARLTAPRSSRKACSPSQGGQP